MKIKFKTANDYENKKRWCFSIFPVIGISWENYSYQKVFMIFFVFLNFNFWVEFEK